MKVLEGLNLRIASHTFFIALALALNLIQKLELCENEFWVWAPSSVQPEEAQAATTRAGVVRVVREVRG